MPREASKRNNWEKERRDRFNRTFDELAKILPSYNPSVTINRIDILKEAITTISEFNKEIGKLSKSPGEVTTFKDDLIKKLKDRIKKLIIRNEQLVKLFQDAGIKLPRAKNKKEKENKHSTGSSTKTEKQKVAKNQGNKHLKSNNSTRKTPLPKKFTKKILATNILFPQLQTVPIYNRQFVLVPNPPVINDTRIATVVTRSPKKTKSKKSASVNKEPESNPPPSILRSGTFILANGNIISVVSQPQIVVPPLQPLTCQRMINPALQSIKISPSVNMSLNPQPAINLAVKMKPITATNIPIIKSKDCLTKTTQINKVPIPALTSKYGNSLLLLKTQTNKMTKKIESNKSNTVKRKKEDKGNITTKKRKPDKQTSTVNNENTGSRDTSVEHTDVIVDSIKTVGGSTNLDNKTENNVTINDNDLSHRILEETEENISNTDNIQNTIIETAETTTTTASIISKTSFPIENEKPEMSANTEIISPVTTTSNIPTAASTTTTKIVTPIEDLNIVHSDLSNEIFASLQVPPGSQNIESTSPTAAFLLTFPLVSSNKVTEVIDDNSDSQKGTPSLLQIGNIDTSKPSQNDSLLNLDNFTFFNSKDIYGYSKVEDGSKREITGSNQFAETKISQKSTVDQKLGLFEEKVGQSGDFVEEEQNNLVVQSSSVHTYDIIRNVNEREDRNINPQPQNVDNDKEQYNCSKEIDQKSLNEQNYNSSSVDIIENSTVSNKIGENHQFLQNGQHKLNSVSSNSGKNLESLPTGQQNANIISSTSNSFIETNSKHDGNKDKEIYNSNGNSFPSNNLKILDTSQTSSPAKNLLHDFFPNVKSYACKSTKLPENSSENNTSFQHKAKNSKEDIDPSKTYCYQTHFLPNSQEYINSYTSSSNKVSDGMSEKLEKSVPDRAYQPFLSNDFHVSLNSAKISDTFVKNSDNTDSVKFCPKNLEVNSNAKQNLEKSDLKKNYYQNMAFPSNFTKMSETPSEKLEESDITKSHHYNSNQFKFSYGPSPAIIPDASRQHLEKSDTNKTYYNATNISSNSASILENPQENLEESEVSKTYQYNMKQFEQNFDSFAKVSKSSGNNLEKPERNKTYFCNTNNLLSNISEKSDKNLEESDRAKPCQYNSKQIELNMNNFGPNLKKITIASGQNSEKSETKKNYCYNPTNFNNTEVPEKCTKLSKESDVTKSYQYNPKPFTVNLDSVVSSSMKVPEISRQNVGKSEASKTYYYTTTKYPSSLGKTPEKSAEISGLSKAAKTCEYNPKEFEINSFANDPVKITESSGQILDKSETNKKYYYNTPTHSSSSGKIQEKSALISEKAGATKTCQNNPKEFELNVNSFETNQTKNPEMLGNSGGNPMYYYNTTKFSSNPGKSDQVLEESNVSKASNYRQFEINSNTLGQNAVKTRDDSGKSFKKSETNETYYYNTSNIFPNSAETSEKSTTSLKEFGGAKTFQYNTKQFDVNLQSFASNTVNISEASRQNLENSDTNKTRYYNSNDFALNSGKMSEKPAEKLEETNVAKACQYNPKQFDINSHSFALNSIKISEASRQHLEKSETNSYYYNTSNFSSNSAKMPEKTAENLEESVTSKSCQYNPKQFELNLNNFGPNLVKIVEASEQNLEKSEANKTYYYNTASASSNSGKTTKESNDFMKTYQYNPFEVVSTSREILLNETYNKFNTSHKDRQTKVVDPSKMLEVCPKSIEEKSCYFSSTSYENKHYTNPFYSNCNYTHGYSENNLNQNYYKSDTKPNYSLNYENYQEYRRTDGSFTRERRNSSTSKEKQVQQNKPVNWMTTEQKSHTSDCFLPTFTNQSYSFTSCITTDTTDNFAEGKKTVETTDKRFTWSPSKLPNLLEVTHNFVTPTLPTLVGDLALGNSLPLTDPKYPKEAKRKTYENQANFLSVSQLVSQNKNDSTPARTVSRRLSGSKTKNTASNKKRFEKNVDKISKNVNNFNDVFYDQKNRPSAKNISSNYSAEALIGNQCTQEEKKFIQTNNKMCTSFSGENVTYFTAPEDNYINQNHAYPHNSFQNNGCCSNSFVYSTPSITSSYLTNNYENAPDYSTESNMNYCGTKDNTNCGSKNYRTTNKDDKNINYSHLKKNKKVNQCNNTSLGNFEFPVLPIQDSTNSPILPDDFQSHATFLPPTTPYNCKNLLYQKQGNEYNSTAILPLPGISRNNTQHPEVSPSLNPVGTSLTNFNLSTIFPEINKGTIPNVHSSNNSKTKNSSNYLEAPYNSDSKYGFTG